MAPLNARIFSLFTLLGVAACTPSAPEPGARSNEPLPPMALATGVTRADGGKGLDQSRLVPLRDMSGDVELLYGDPEAAGQVFVMRIRELPGAVVPPHSHPVDEHITVVKGTWYFGFGERFDPKVLHELKAGAYAFAPKGAWMFGYAPDEAVVQVHGVGPFQIHWHDGAKSLNDPDASATFRLKRGDKVASARGGGRIVEGYASGTLIQYEIEKSTGERFMEYESELRAQ